MGSFCRGTYHKLKCKCFEPPAILDVGWKSRALAAEAKVRELENKLMISDFANIDSLSHSLSMAQSKIAALESRLWAGEKVIETRRAIDEFDCIHYEPPCDCAATERKLWAAYEQALAAYRAGEGVGK